MQRHAVDSTASNYWTQYFKDSGYGALWVRKLPRRIKAALQREGHYMSGLEPKITGLGHAISKDKVTLDGVALGYQHGPDGRPRRIARAFVADFDHQGRLLSFESLESP